MLRGEVVRQSQRVHRRPVGRLTRLARGQRIQCLPGLVPDLIGLVERPLHGQSYVGDGVS